MHKQLNYILNELRSAWRFRWLALAAAWLASLAGWAWVSTQADVYEARARVYVDTTSELRRILGNQIVEPDLEAQLNYVRESMLGRVQLERVARETGLALAADDMIRLDSVISRLRSRINISVSGGQRGRAANNIYTISYRDSNPQMALNVVQNVLNTFQEDTLGARRQGSESARQFLEMQVRELEQRLAEAEQRRADFNREHADVLPGREGGYWARLQTETTLLENTQAQLDLALSRRNQMREQLSGERPMTAPQSGPPAPGSLEARIIDHERRLEDLLLRYTPRHPDVEAAQETLARLREEQATQAAALAASGGAGAETSANPVYQALQISLNEVEAEIASLTADVQRRQMRVAQLRSLMSEVPEVEAQLARLDRDYDVIHAQYQSLLRSMETERLTREASETDQVEFNVIDPPLATNEPVAPQRPLLLLSVLFAGFGGGGALAYLLAQLRPVFPDPRLLREVSGLPVLGAVSRTWQTRHKVRRTVEVTTFALACCGLLAVFAIVYLFEVAGPGLRSLLG